MSINLGQPVAKLFIKIPSEFLSDNDLKKTHLLTTKLKEKLLGYDIFCTVGTDSSTIDVNVHNGHLLGDQFDIGPESCVVTYKKTEQLVIETLTTLFNEGFELDIPFNSDEIQKQVKQCDYYFSTLSNLTYYNQAIKNRTELNQSNLQFNLNFSEEIQLYLEETFSNQPIAIFNRSATLKQIDQWIFEISILYKKSHSFGVYCFEQAVDISTQISDNDFLDTPAYLDVIETTEKSLSKLNLCNITENITHELFLIFKLAFMAGLESATFEKELTMH